jgi:ferric-dicitrate binding protein FerR (iron transport regulator)
MDKDINSKDTYLAKWLIGDLSDEDLKSNVGEQDYLMYLKVKRALEVSEQLDAPIENSFHKLEARVQSKGKPVISLMVKRVLGIAASLLILFGIFNLLKSNDHNVATNIGEHKSYVLEDGSEILLNSKSTITYNPKDWAFNRELTLKGEAYFKVAKGKTFTVITPNGTVEVLGTEFDVNSTKDFFDVVCYEGKVKVTTNDNRNHILLPGQTVRKINGFQTEANNTKDDAPSWISGESTFKRVPLIYVIEALQKQFDITIQHDKIDTSVLYSGAFPHDNKNMAMQIVFSSLNINKEYISESNLKLSNSK